MKNYVVDFESYYSKNDISAAKLGNQNYYENSYAYCVSVVGEGTKWVGTIDDARDAFPAGFWADPEHQFWAAHANFDMGWADRVFVPSARPWKCILDRGAAQQLPHNVAGLVKTVLGREADKTTRDWMSGKHFKDLSEEDQKRVLDYCLHDAEEEYALLQQIPEPTPTEDALAEHTRALNRRGIHIDVERVDRDKTLLEKYQHEAWCGIPWRNSAERPLSFQSLVKYCNAHGIPAPKNLDKRDDEVENLIEVTPALAQVVGAMRRYRHATTMIRKLHTVLDRVTSGGVLPLEMMYCGARHTRRWSSRGVNIQNLDREPLWIDADAKLAWESSPKGTPLEVFDGKFVWMRHWLIPPPGKLFLSLDYSQIEPRCLNWMVGNEAFLEATRAGFSAYEAYARVVKGWRGEKGTLKKQLGVAAYTLVKNEVLGLGYGMGAAKYTGYAGVTQEFAQETVRSFRRNNPKIVKFWLDRDQEIARAAVNREDLELEMFTGDWLRHFKVQATPKGGYESWTTKGDFGALSHQPRLWGGTMTENVTQRFARDVLGEAILRLEAAGFVVALTAHDEIVLAVDKDNAEDAEREATRLMTIPPDWAPGLPLAVEGGLSDRYSK